MNSPLQAERVHGHTDKAGGHGRDHRCRDASSAGFKCTTSWRAGNEDTRLGDFRETLKDIRQLVSRFDKGYNAVLFCAGTFFQLRA